MIFIKRNSGDFTDEALMKFIGAGDRAAFDELYNRYHNRLFYYFYRMLGNCEETANDFLQDIFLKIIDKPQLFNPDYSFKKWIFSVAHNMCKNEYRKRENHKTILQDIIPENIKDEINPDREDKSRWIEIAFREMEGLSEKSREILVLKYRENFSLDEISEILSLPKGTVKSRLFYARNELTKLVKYIQNMED
ncbi:RNA polymerase sigma factor [Maribellus maritimus]|uniref:RNA polymerase sigma factor n=1 Tax=Maribellus maritimus TaxID=2870838 RepID=UPI001EEA8B3D|nr:RNA polymerase sigma factor [Maribellus maritimus]MCG6188570.1 RNA polymerase sigma factor [Maribellus maritimus]